MSVDYYYITSKESFCDRCNMYHLDQNPHIFIGHCNLALNFALHVYSDIPNLDTWKVKWEVPGTLIVDGGGRQVSPIDMLTIITMRGFNQSLLSYDPSYTLGAHGLLRANLGSRFAFGNNNGTSTCIENQDTYDLFTRM